MDRKMAAYTHIQKSMFDARQDYTKNMALIVKREGPYYHVTKDTNDIKDVLVWTIHESNIEAIFKAEHKIWPLLYL